MTRRNSVPPLPLTEARQAQESFARASDILSVSGAPRARRKFSHDATEVRQLAESLAVALEQGAELQEIDRLTVSLQRKCLTIQQLTLRARSDR